MTPGLDPVLKRTRVSTSKVRTGCSTCKARRVKCDEAKPTCRRCTVGRRECEYTLTPVARRPRNVITVYLPPAQLQPAFFINDRDLDFFHRKLAAMLDGQFDSKFWTKLVLQLSHSEPSIRHAVSAISVTYRDVELSLQQPSGHVSLNSEAQQEWNLAIRNLSARIQAHPESNLVPLVCCLVFTCIELLRGNIDSSLFHVQNGFNILAALHRRSNANPESQVNLSSKDLEAIEDHIAPVFLGLNVLCSLAGIATPPVYTLTPKQDSPHEGLAYSRRRLCEISDTCIRFIGPASLKAAVFQIDFNDLVEQAKLQTSLDLWRDQLDRHVQQMEAAGIPVNQGALNQLLVQHKVVHIWTRVCTTAGETATDSYHADFEELVHYAEQIVNSDTGMTTPQPLSFDIQTLGPLYYAALKCRYAATRRRALEMLRSAPRREGLWNAHYAYATAKRVIEVEERHLNEQGLPDETSRVHHLPLPDDQSRIYNLFDNFEKAGHDGLPNPPDPCVVKIVFYTKPWGLLGQWQTTTEYIEL